jgi:hypothetical protein
MAMPEVQCPAVGGGARRVGRLFGAGRNALASARVEVFTATRVMAAMPR